MSSSVAAAIAVPVDVVAKGFDRRGKRRAKVEADEDPAAYRFNTKGRQTAWFNTKGRQTTSPFIMVCFGVFVVFSCLEG